MVLRLKDFLSLKDTQIFMDKIICVDVLKNNKVEEYRAGLAMSCWLLMTGTQSSLYYFLYLICVKIKLKKTPKTENSMWMFNSLSQSVKKLPSGERE